MPKDGEHSALKEVQDQLRDMQELLNSDPENPEIDEMIKQLTDTEQLLLSSAKQKIPAAIAGAQPVHHPDQSTLASPPLSELCQVPVGDEHRIAQILSEKNSMVRVKFFGQPVIKEFPEDQLIRPLVPISLKHCVKGARLQAARLEKDGGWYDCTVIGSNSVTGEAFLVTFDRMKDATDKKLIEVPVELLRKRPQSKDGPFYVTEGGFKIPEQYKIDEKDSEEVREVKKRKIAYSKKLQKEEQKGAEHEERKSAWQNFRKGLK